MMNPFLQVPPQGNLKTRTEMNEELAAQQYAKTTRNSGSRRNVGLWAGNLLIRIGKKLAEQDVDLQTSKEHA